MKVIFLDFDGVLNHTEWLKENFETYHLHPLNPEAVAVLNSIMRQVEGVKVVISSTWRLDGVAHCRGHLAHAGFAFVDKVIGRTGSNSFGRGEEILEWIRAHQAAALHMDELVTHYVILDDDVFDMGAARPHVVRIDRETGLTLDHVPGILRHLQEE